MRVENLRDKIALSLDILFIPKLENELTIKHVAENLGIEVDVNDIMSMMDFAFKYQSIMRYKYADEMLAVSGDY